jgi:3'(2'), 5'-bisphosphate nucleotidase
MGASEFSRLAEELLSAVLAAARVQMSLFRTDVAVETKADQSPVTLADQQSEALILACLAKVAPDVPVIAEEAVTAGRIPPLAGSFFLVDPLDGTKGFIRGRSEFTINIGLIENGRPTFGLIYAPALADFYVTLDTGHAANARLEANAEAGSLADLQLRRVRTRVPDPNALSALTSHTHLNRATVALLDSYGAIDRRAIASSLKFGLLARGEADLGPRTDTKAAVSGLQLEGGYN